MFTMCPCYKSSVKRCQVVKKMSSCQKDVKCQIVKHLDYGGGSQKKINWHDEVHTYWRQFWHQIWRSSKLPKKYFLWTFWGFLVTIICDVKIDINICEPHCVNLFFLWTSSIVQVFDFLTFDIFLTTWHFFDNLTSFWHLTYNMGTWWTCAGSCVQWILPIPIRSRWGTGVMGHMGNGAHGQWGPWVIGTFWPITSLLLDGFLQKFYWT